MAGFKRTVTISIGMTQVVCDLTGMKITGAEPEFVQLCANGHEPWKPKWDPQCASCGTVSRGSLVKGQEIAKDQFVVFTAEEVAAMRSEDGDQYKGQLLLTAHLVDEVGSQVMPNGTTYLLTPCTDRKKAPGDQRPFYAMLREYLGESDVVYLGRYTVTSKASLYRVRLYNGVIIAEQMLDTDQVVEIPSLDDVPAVPEQMAEMVHQTAKLLVQPFDKATYANRYAATVAAAVAARDAVDGTGALPTTPVVTTQASADPFAAMQAQMEAFLAAQAPAAVTVDEAVAEGSLPGPAKKARKKAASRKPKADAA